MTIATTGTQELAYPGRDGDRQTLEVLDARFERDVSGGAVTLGARSDAQDALVRALRRLTGARGEAAVHT